MRIEWLIIGGGIHGVHMAARLLGDVGIDHQDVVIVDPCKRLLERWRTCTETTGMTYLRSPAVHHLDLNPWSLKYFVKEQCDDEDNPYQPPFERPMLSIFNEHCEEVIENFALDQIHDQAHAVDCRVKNDGVHVQLSTGQTMIAKNVILAIGSGDQPYWPQWASEGQTRISHIFDPHLENWPTSKETLGVVGGGISACQAALRLVREGHVVHLISRRALRIHQFDSEPGWLGPKLMRGFSAETDVNLRRKLITEARHKGSVPHDVYRSIREAINQGQIHWHEDQIKSLTEHDEELVVNMSRGTSLRVQHIFLATGFSTMRPGGQMIDRLIQSAHLPCADCGYPIIDEALRWHPRIFVSGPLAELELGPVSRNIAGARRAGDRLVKAMSSGKISTA